MLNIARDKGTHCEQLTKYRLSAHYFKDVDYDIILMFDLYWIHIVPRYQGMWKDLRSHLLKENIRIIKWLIV